VVVNETSPVSIAVGRRLTESLALPHVVVDSTDPWVIAHAHSLRRPGRSVSVGDRIC
jgi:hypothetical protein